MKRIIIAVLVLVALATGAQAEMTQMHKRSVWHYYTNAEDMYGMDKAEILTSKKFKISVDQVIAVKVEGGMNSWPLPGEENEPVISEEQRLKQNKEAAEEFRKAAQRRKERGY
jgi:hypothetical protein